MIRATTAGDEDTLWLMLYHASHSYEEPGVGPEDVRSNPDLVGYIAGWHQTGRIGVLAETADGSIGAAWLRRLGEADMGNPVFIDTDVPELAIAVLPEHQGVGVGTLLMEALLERAGGFPGIVLSVRAGNPAIRLYERFGFETIDEMTNRVGTKSVKMLRPTPG